MLKGLDFMARLSIPDLQSFICTAADDPLAVRTQGHASDRARVSLDGEDFLAFLRIPDLQGRVPTPTDDPLAVRT